MHIYNNLDEDVKVYFRRDAFTLMLLTIFNLYCVLVLSLTKFIDYFSNSVLFILLLNMLFFAIPFSGILYNLRYNRVAHIQNPETALHVLPIALYIASSIAILFYYYVIKKEKSSYLEFAPILLYTVLYCTIILYYIFRTVSVCGSECFRFFRETKEAIDEREYLFKNKKPPEEAVVQQNSSFE